MKKNLMVFAGKAKAVRIFFIAALLMINVGCAVRSPQIGMRGIDTMNSIQFEDVAVNAKETLPITATINLETQSGMPTQYEHQLKEKIKKTDV